MKQKEIKVVGQKVSDALRENRAPYKRLAVEKEVMVEEEYDLRLITANRSLAPEVLETLSQYDLGVEYLGPVEDGGPREYQWRVAGTGDKPKMEAKCQ